MFVNLIVFSAKYYFDVLKCLGAIFKLFFKMFFLSFILILRQAQYEHKRT